MRVYRVKYLIVLTFFLLLHFVGENLIWFYTYNKQDDSAIFKVGRRPKFGGHALRVWEWKYKSECVSLNVRVCVCVCVWVCVWERGRQVLYAPKYCRSVDFQLLCSQGPEHSIPLLLKTWKEFDNFVRIFHIRFNKTVSNLRGVHLNKTLKTSTRIVHRCTIVMHVILTCK